MIRCVNRQGAVQKRKKNMRLAAAFCLFMGTSPINFGLLGGNGNTLKLEMTTKLKDKQTSIATVRDLLRTFATFPAPLFSHCRLPLNSFVRHTGHGFFPYREKNPSRRVVVLTRLQWFSQLDGIHQQKDLMDECGTACLKVWPLFNNQIEASTCEDVSHCPCSLPRGRDPCHTTS
jgi:hypothetical protein